MRVIAVSLRRDPGDTRPDGQPGGATSTVAHNRAGFIRRTSKVCPRTDDASGNSREGLAECRTGLACAAGDAFDTDDGTVPQRKAARSRRVVPRCVPLSRPRARTPDVLSCGGAVERVVRFVRSSDGAVVLLRRLRPPGQGRGPERGGGVEPHRAVGRTGEDVRGRAIGRAVRIDGSPERRRGRRAVLVVSHRVGDAARRCRVGRDDGQSSVPPPLPPLSPPPSPWPEPPPWPEPSPP